MEVTNDETTGRTSVCRICQQPIEEGLLLKGFRGSPGQPTWRSLDRGPASAVCYRNPAKVHEPEPTGEGSAFHRGTR